MAQQVVTPREDLRAAESRDLTSPGAEQVRRAIQRGERVCLRAHGLTPDVAEQFRETTRAGLDAVAKQDLFNSLSLVIAELTANAERANMKRAYFHSCGLNMNSRADYERGMTSFAEARIERRDDLRDRLQEEGLYVELAVQFTDGVLTFTVENNARPTPTEWERITSRLKQARDVSSLAEAFMLVGDESESAGLGLTTVVLTLRALGAQDDALTISPAPNRDAVIAQVRLPVSALTDSQAESLSDEIAAKIESLPKFPQDILALQAMLADPDVDLGKVADCINRDPALVTDLLRMINSARFMLRYRVGNIRQALGIMGIAELRRLLLCYGAHLLIGGHLDRFAALSNHAQRCAAIAYVLAERCGHHRERDDAYVAGLLHDIGRIILFSLNDGLLRRVETYCAGKGIPGDVVEALAAGASHANVGGRVTEHWKFPENITTAIQYHHQPRPAPPEHRDLVSLVHVADYLALSGTGIGAHAPPDPDVLARLGVADVESLRALVEQELAARRLVESL